jgi:hypothetical protein
LNVLCSVQSNIEQCIYNRAIVVVGG